MSDRRVLVVGTTPDYVAHIHERYPGRALFLIAQTKPDDPPHGLLIGRGNVDRRQMTVPSTIYLIHPGIIF